MQTQEETQHQEAPVAQDPLEDSEDEVGIPILRANNKHYQLTQDSDEDLGTFSDCPPEENGPDNEGSDAEKEDSKPPAQPTSGSSAPPSVASPPVLVSPTKPNDSELGNLQNNMSLHEPVKEASLQEAIDARYKPPQRQQPPATTSKSSPTETAGDTPPNQQVIKLKRTATQDLSPNAKKANFDVDRLGTAIKTVLYTIGLVSGDVLTVTERKKGLEPPYLSPIANLFRNSDATMKKAAKTDFFAYERRPNDPNSIMEYDNRNRPANPFRRLLFLNNLSEHENTLQARETIGRRLANFINHHATQNLFRYPAKCAYGGDITPQRNIRPYLSDYFTIKDTFQFLSTEPFYDKTISEISDIEPIMALYFRTDLRAQAWDFAHNGPADNPTSEQTGPSLEDYDDLAS
jgi:hypothetical protein